MGPLAGTLFLVALLAALVLSIVKDHRDRTRHGTVDTPPDPKAATPRDRKEGLVTPLAYVGVVPVVAGLAFGVPLVLGARPSTAVVVGAPAVLVGSVITARTLGRPGPRRGRGS
jgi:hypothetical protein